MIDKIYFVSDRGSNLVKALENFNVIHCFLHRLNNILKRTFYSAGTREKAKGRGKERNVEKIQFDDQPPWNDSMNNNRDPSLDYDDRDSSGSDSDEETALDPKSVELGLSNSTEQLYKRDHINVPQQNVPLHASQVLTTICRCKQLCRYVKRVIQTSWNE